MRWREQGGGLWLGREVRLEMERTRSQERRQRQTVAESGEKTRSQERCWEERLDLRWREQGARKDG